MTGFEYLIKFLKEEGFRYDLDGKMATFKIQGTNFLVFNNEGPFLKILLLCNMEGYSRSQLLELCNSFNQEKVIIKFTVTDDSKRVLCSYEFAPDANTKSDDFMGAFAVLDHYSDQFWERLNNYVSK